MNKKNQLIVILLLIFLILILLFVINRMGALRTNSQNSASSVPFPLKDNIFPEQARLKSKQTSREALGERFPRQKGVTATWFLRFDGITFQNFIERFEQKLKEDEFFKIKDSQGMSNNLYIKDTVIIVVDRPGSENTDILVTVSIYDPASKYLSTVEKTEIP